jgi:hypothetical protein
MIVVTILIGFGRRELTPKRKLLTVFGLTQMKSKRQKQKKDVKAAEKSLMDNP